MSDLVERLRAGLEGAPISPLLQRGKDEPEWRQLDSLFRRFNLDLPPMRLADELTNILSWARWGELLLPDIRALLDRLVAVEKREAPEPPLSCPAIDAFIKDRNPPADVVAELEDIRHVNSQLRYGLWHEKQRADRAEAALASESSSRELEEAREALKPFATSPYAKAPADMDDLEICAGIKVSDLRRARTLISKDTPNAE